MLSNSLIVGRWTIRERSLSLLAPSLFTVVLVDDLAQLLLVVVIAITARPGAIIDRPTFGSQIELTSCLAQLMASARHLLHLLVRLNLPHVV